MADDKPRGLLLAMIDIDPAHEEEFNRWYNEEHLPDRQNCPGFLNGRRFKLVDGPGPKYLALYDLEGPEVLDGDDYKKIASSPWTEKLRQHYRATRNVYIEITPKPGSGD